VAQVDAAFSKTRRQGYKNDITTWGNLGLNGAYTKMPISLYGRNSASGTYGFFKKKVLQNGDFRNQVKEQPGSASVVHGVTEDRAGMGYSGIGYRTSGVRAIPLAMKEGADFVEPTFANASKGSYPLARFLFVYVNKAPNKPLSPIVKEFLKFVYSREGQNVVIKDGYFPLSANLMMKQRGNFE
jgi:phosphate transport system substrate-binding protein